MKGFSLILVLVALVQWSSGYSTYDRAEANKPDVASHTTYSYHSSSISSSSSASPASSNRYDSCCDLDIFGLDHLKEVQEFANRLKQKYKLLLESIPSVSEYEPWSKSICSLTGKSSQELDEICRRKSEQLVNDLRNGLFASQDLNKNNFFEWVSSDTLRQNNVHDFKYDKASDFGHNENSAVFSSNGAENHHVTVNARGNDQQRTVDLPDLKNAVNTHSYDQQQTSVLDFPDSNVPENPNLSVNTYGYGSQLPSEFHSVVSSVNEAGNHHVPANAYGNDQQRTVYVNLPNSKDTENTHSYDQQQTSVLDFPDSNVPENPNLSVNTYGYGSQLPSDFHSVVSLVKEAGKHHVPANAYGNDQQRTVYVNLPKSKDAENTHSYDQQQTSVLDFPDSNVPENPNLSVNTYGYGSQLPSDFHSVVSPVKEAGKHHVPANAYGNDQQRTVYVNLPKSKDAENTHSYDQQQTSVLDFPDSNVPENPNLSVNTYGYGSLLPSDFHSVVSPVNEAGKHHVPVNAHGHDQQRTVDPNLPNFKYGGVHLVPKNIHKYDQQQTSGLDFPDSNIPGNPNPSVNNYGYGLPQGSDIVVPHLNNDGKHLPVETSTVTVSRYNRTVFTTPDGTVSTGSEQHKKWINGNLIYNIEGPLGNSEKWQQEELTNIKQLIDQENLVFEELQTFLANNKNKIKKLSFKYNVPEKDVQEWLQKVVNAHKKTSETRDWHSQWRTNVANMLKEREFTDEEFDKWSLENKEIWQRKYKLNNIKSDDLEQLIKDEKRRLLYFSMLKPTEKPTNWQQHLENLLDNVVLTPFQSFEELEEKLKTLSNELNKIAKDYYITIDQIEAYMKTYITKLFNEGKLKINSLLAWQVPARKLLSDILRDKPDCSLDELHDILRQYNFYIQNIAFQNHKSDKEIEEYMKNELSRLQQPDKLNTDATSQWRHKQERILNFLKQKQNISFENMEKKSLIRQYDYEVDVAKQQTEQILKNLNENTLDAGLNQWQNNKVESLAKIQKQISSAIENWNKIIADSVSDLHKQRIAKQNEERPRYSVLISRGKNLLEQQNEDVNNAVTDISNKLTFDKNNLLKVIKEKLNAWLKNKREHQYETPAHDSEFIENIIQKQLNELSLKYDSEVLKKINSLRDKLGSFPQHQLFRPEEVNQYLRSQHDNFNQVIQLELPKFQYNINKLQEQYVQDANNLIDQINKKADEINNWVFEKATNLQKYGVSEVKKGLHDWEEIGRNQFLVSDLPVRELKQKLESYRDQLHQVKNRCENIKTNIESEKKKLDDNFSLKLQELNELRLQLLKNFDATLRQIASYGQNQIDNEVIVLNQFESDLNKNIVKYENLLATDILNLASLRDEVINTIKDLKEGLGPDMESVMQAKYNILNNLLNSERQRLVQIVPHGLAINIDNQVVDDRKHLLQIANEFNINFGDLEKWYKQELLRLKTKAQLQVTLDNIKNMIAHNGYNKQQFNEKIVQNYQIISHLASLNGMKANKFLEWLEAEITDLYEKGFFNKEHKGLTEWQRKEKEYLENIIRKYRQATRRYLKLKIDIDQAHLNQVAAKYDVKVPEIKKWLLQEIDHLEFLGDLRPENLNTWQESLIDMIIFNLERNNKLTIDDLKHNLLSDRQLFSLAQKYHVNTTEIATFVEQICQNLQELGLYNRWQVVVHEYIINLILKYNPSIKELSDYIEKDFTYLSGIAKQYNVRFEKVTNFIKNEIEKLNAEHYFDRETLKEWQTEWRKYVIAMLKERDFTPEDFSEWLAKYISHTHPTASDIEEARQWFAHEVQRFIILGLLKPNENLTPWQVEVRKYLSDALQQPCQSFEELEQRLRDRPQLFAKLANEHHIEAELIESWMKKELVRFLTEGKLKIDNHSAWQISLEKHLVSLLKQKPTWTLQELIKVLKRNEDYYNLIAFRYHQSPEDIKNWIISLATKHFQKPENLESYNVNRWMNEKQPLFNLFEHLFKTIIESKAEETHRAYLGNSIKNHIENLVQIHGNLEKYKNHLMQDDLLQKFQIHQRKELHRLQEFQSELASILEKNPLEQLLPELSSDIANYSRLITYDDEFLNKFITTYHEEVKKVQEHVTGDTDTYFRKESHKDLLAWQEQQKVPIISVHDKQTLEDDLEVKSNYYGNQLSSLTDKYVFKAKELYNWLHMQMEELKSQEDTTFENLEEWKKSEFIKRDDLKKSYEEAKKNIIQKKNAVHNKLSQLASDIEQTVAELDNWSKSKAHELQAIYGAKLQNELTNLENLIYNRIIAATEQDYLSIKELEDKIKTDDLELQPKRGLVEKYEKLISNAIESATSEGARKLTQLIYKLTEDSKTLSNAVQQLTLEMQELLNAIPQQIQKFLYEHKASLNKFKDSFNSLLKHVRDASSEYNNNFVDLQRKFQDEMYRLKNEVNRITELLDTERNRLRDIFKRPHSSPISVDMQVAEDFNHLQTLASRYNINLKVLNEWEKQQLERLQKDAQNQKAFDDHEIHIYSAEKLPDIIKEFVKEWLRKKQNADVTTRDFDEFVKNGERHWQNFANIYKVDPNEIYQLLYLEKSKLPLLDSDKFTTASEKSQLPNPELLKKSIRSYLITLTKNKPISWEMFNEFSEAIRNNWNNFDTKNSFGILDKNTLLNQIGQELADKGLIYNKVTNQGTKTNVVSGLQQLIRDKLNSHQTLSIDEIKNSLSGGSHFGQSQIKIENFGKQQHQSYDYFSHQELPVQSSFGANAFTVKKYLNAQRLPAGNYFGQSQLEYGQHQVQTDEHTNQPQVSVKSYGRYEIPALETQEKVHDLSKLFA